MHLLHINFTLPVGRHPNRTIVLYGYFFHAPDFQQGETARPLLALRFSIDKYVSFSHS
jgi:hypothetical protein